MSDETTPRPCWMHEFDDDTIYDTPEDAVHGWCDGDRGRGERTLELIRMDPVSDNDLRVIAQGAAALAWDDIDERCYEMKGMRDGAEPAPAQRTAVLDALMQTLRDQRMHEEVERINARDVLGEVFDDILDSYDAELAEYDALEVDDE